MNDCILSICIVSYNTSDLTLDAVRSSAEDVQRSELLKKKTEIIVVDNNSTDDSLKVLETYAAESSVPITFIKNTDNSGFAVANNQAITKSKGKYILLLNSDTYVQPGALGKLISAFEETKDASTADLSTHPRTLDRLGILTASLVNSDGTYQHQGGSYPTLFSLINHMLFFDDIPLIGKYLPSTQKVESYSEPHSDHPDLMMRGWVAGTVMVLRKDMLDEIGLLDEKIFMYGEDVELCIRAKDHHWDIAQHPGAYVTHLKSASSSSANAIDGELKGYQHIWSKHKPIWQYPLVNLIIRTGIVLRVLLFDTMRRKEQASMYKNAWKNLA